MPSLKAFSKNWRSLQGKYVLCQYPRARITTFVKETTLKINRAKQKVSSQPVVSNYERRINAFVSDKWVMMNLTLHNLIFVGQMSLKGSSWMFNSSRHRLCTILQTTPPDKLPSPCQNLACTRMFETTFYITVSLGEYRRPLFPLIKMRADKRKLKIRILAECSSTKKCSMWWSIVQFAYVASLKSWRTKKEPIMY